MDTQNLSSRAMLVSLHISMWTARKKDGKQSRDVAQRNHVSEKMASVHKRLLPENSPSYDAAISAASSARSYFYEQTSPWSDEGSRILASANFMDFTLGMKAQESKVETAFDYFIADFARLVCEAENSLNGMFRKDDYPSQRELKDKFSIKLSVFPLPSANDFRVNLSEDTVSAIRASIEETVSESSKVVRQDLSGRLQVVLSTMSDKLSVPGAIYRDSLFENVEDTCALVLRLNVFNDLSIVEAVEQVRERVLLYRPQQCRDSKAHRAKAAKSVDEIMRLMEGF